MKKNLITGFLAIVVSAGLKAQQKHTFQYSPGVNKKSISGVIIKMKNLCFRGQELRWVYIGDTVIHVWDKDFKREMEIGKMFTFNGVQKLVGVKKYLDK